MIFGSGFTSYSYLAVPVDILGTTIAANRLLAFGLAITFIACFVGLQGRGGAEGVGEALVQAAQAWARCRGYRMMQLYVLPGNAGARRLYERMGYRAEWLKYVKPLE